MSHSTKTPRAAPDVSPSRPDDPLLDEYVAVLAHELKTPLAVIGAATKFGLERQSQEPGDPDDRQLLEVIHRNVELATGLLTRLGLARDIEAGTVKLTLDTFDMGVLVGEAVEDLRSIVLSDHPVDVVIPTPTLVRADPTACREILFNLLANAAKYSHSGAQIAVIVETAETDVNVVVRNHGSGVTPGDTEAIFDKFAQGDSGSAGAGLGLFISRGLARAHGGDIRVRPAKDIGSEFELSLPAMA